MTDVAWARLVPDGWELALRVQPGARTTEVVGEHGDALKLRVAAPANDGKANAALVRFLAAELGVSASVITVVRGVHHRSKVLRIAAPIDPRRLLPEPGRT